MELFLSLLSGTREGKTATVESDGSWFDIVTKYFKYFCWCCIPPHLREKPPTPDKEEVEVEEDDKDKEEVNIFFRISLLKKSYLILIMLIF